MPSLPSLIDNLVADDWRADHPFSSEIMESHTALLAATNDADRATLLGQWLEKYQPCVFGALAAKKGLIDYCFLTEADLRAGDHHVAAAIAKSRFNWRSRARKGASHGFIILAISDFLAKAEPSQALLAVAQKLAELYLCREVPSGKIVHDELFLEANECRSWKVGVNYFSSHGDGRWWKDHRIPGGIAFSMNSVGHMACARRIDKGAAESDQSQGLHWALRLAMNLLDRTTPGPSGRDTWLHDVAARPELAGVECPAGLPESLASKNRCEYGGLYHTDQTLPEVYFDPAVVRPDGPLIENLDLTYLYRDSPENPDFRSMGAGLKTN